MCMAEQGFSKDVAFDFLKEIEAKWRSMFGAKGTSAGAFEMDEVFHGPMIQLMEEFSVVSTGSPAQGSTGASDSDLDTLQRECQELKDLTQKLSAENKMLNAKLNEFQDQDLSTQESLKQECDELKALTQKLQEENQSLANQIGDPQEQSKS